MDDQSPDTPEDERLPADLRRGPADEPAGEDTFVLSAEERPQRRWLASTPNYEPEQFDLTSLPDAEEAPAAPETKADRPAPPAQEPASGDSIRDTSLPLGFVSEPRPVARQPRPENAAPTDNESAPKLGFISHEEIAAGRKGADVPQDAVPPLGFVSEPRPVAAQTVTPEPVSEPLAEPPQQSAATELPTVPDLPEPVEQAPAEAQPISAEPAPVQPEPPTEPEAPVAAPLSVPEPPPVPPTAEPEVAPAYNPLQTASEQEASQAPAEEAVAELTPGQMLRTMRSNKGLSVEDIVQRSRMTPETILALEADQPPPQNAWVYVRGFYSRYAKALGIPEAPLIAAHERLNGKPAEAQPALAPELTPEDVSPPKRSHKMLFVTIGGVVLGVLAWWLLPLISGYVNEWQPRETAKAALSSVKSTASEMTDKSTGLYKQVAEKVKASRPQPVKRAPTEAAPAAAQPVQTQTVAPAPEAEPLAQESLSIEPAAVQPEAVAPADEASHEALQAPQAEVVEQSAPTSVETAEPARETRSPAVAPIVDASPVLSLDFQRQSWVSVADADGQLLFEGMVEEGEQRRFEGKLPLTLFLGTARAVQVSFAGQHVNLTKDLRPNGTARVVLGE